MSINRENKPLGMVINAAKPHEFEFIAERSIRIGELVTFETPEGEALGFVKDSRVNSKLFNDEKITNYHAAIEAKRIVSENERDKYRVASINVLGLVKDLTMPSLPPDPGTEIYNANEEILKKIFRKDGKEWIKVGNLLRGTTDVYVNINKVASRHLAILATTGSGKSNFLALIIDRLANINGTMILFDYHGEYRYEDNKRNIYHIKPRINPYHLTSYEFADMIGIRENAEKQRTILSEVFREVKENKENNDIWSRLLRELNTYEKNDVAVRVGEIIRMAQENLQSIFDEEIRDILDEIRQNKTNIIDMTDLNERQAIIVISHYLKKILNDRKRRDGRLSSPVLIAIEEAHAFIPSDKNDKNEAAEIISKIAREGRKFGVGLIIISQRPRKINQDVLSQMGSLAISRIIQPNDQHYIFEVTENIPNELLEHLPSLNPGEMLLTGQWITIPSLVKIEKVNEKLGGADIDAVNEWSKKREDSYDEMIKS